MWKPSSRVLAAGLLLALIMATSGGAVTRAAQDAPVSGWELGIALSALHLPDGVRYAIVLQRAGSDGPAEATVHVTLPTGSALVSALETSGGRLIDSSEHGLRWEVRFDDGTDTDPLSFVLRDPASEPISIVATWEGEQPGQTALRAAPEIQPATALEGEVTLMQGEQTVAGVGIAALSEGAREVSLRVRRLPTAANPPVEAGDLWWCALLAIDGMQEGEGVLVSVPARQPLRPHAAVQLFALREGAWIALPDTGNVTADGQFITFVHRGGVVAAGVQPTFQPVAALLKPFIQFETGQGALAPDTVVGTVIRLRLFTGAASADRLRLRDASNLTFAGFGSTQIPGVVCFSGSGTNQFGFLPMNCGIASVSPLSEPHFVINLRTTATSGSMACVTVLWAEGTASEIRGRFCRYVNANPLDIVQQVSTSAGGSNQTPISVNNTATLTITPRVGVGATAGARVAVVLPANLAITSIVAVGGSGGAAPWSCATRGDGTASLDCELTSAAQVAAVNDLTPLALTVRVTSCSTAIPVVVSNVVPDGSASNNQASLSLAVNCPVLRIASFALNPAGPFALNVQTAIITYSAVIVNDGGGATTSTVTARLRLPEALDFSPDNETPSAWSCSIDSLGLGEGKEVICTANTAFAAGASKTLTITARYTAPACIPPFGERVSGSAAVRLRVTSGGVLVETTRQVGIAVCRATL